MTLVFMWCLPQARHMQTLNVVNPYNDQMRKYHLMDEKTEAQRG